MRKKSVAGRGCSRGAIRVHRFFGPAHRASLKLTAVIWLQHPRPVLTCRSRLVALAIAAFMTAGNVAVCAGWAATPEARMACCTDEDNCPMHKGGDSSRSERVISQAQADACSAVSERQQSNQSTPTFVTVITSAVLGVGVVVPMTAPALVLSDGWRTLAPIPIAPVPSHVLFSVFLV